MKRKLWISLLGIILILATCNIAYALPWSVSWGGYLVTCDLGYNYASRYGFASTSYTGSPCTVTTTLKLYYLDLWGVEHSASYAKTDYSTGYAYIKTKNLSIDDTLDHLNSKHYVVYNQHTYQTSGGYYAP